MDDQLLLRDALRENGITSSDVIFVENGDELLTLLEDRHARPILVLLDLNMPKKDGREALREIKTSERHRHIPIVVLTTSSSEDDVRLAYRSGANTFFIKPPIFQDLVEIVRVIKLYWLEKAALAH